MSKSVRLACALGALVGASAATEAGIRFGGEGPTLVWVTIRAHPGEGLWQACRRAYQRDVYVVQYAPGNKVRCKVEHSRIYRSGERRQNFNN